jgi:hypothetical protein
MKTSNYWTGHFKANALQKRVDWTVSPAISREEIDVILPSLQAWQLGETSEGRHLIAASEKYASKIADPDYVDAVKLFIKEEQKHGHNLGCYLDSIGKPRIKHNWGDTLFRKVRYFNTSMELWTLAVIVVESTAQIFYLALKDATNCELLKSICDDILVDEAYHITFQTERLAIIFSGKTSFSKAWRRIFYRYFFYGVSALVWFAHRKLFKAGGNSFEAYTVKMKFKYIRTLKMVITAPNYEPDKISFEL